MNSKQIARRMFPEQCRAYGLPEPAAEHRFHPIRKWRLDYVFAGRVAIEVQGGIWVGGKHARGAGLEKDYEKLNTAQLMGWIVLQFTPRQIANGVFAGAVRDALNFRILQGYDWTQDDAVGFPNHVKRGLALDGRHTRP